MTKLPPVEYRAIELLAIGGFRMYLSCRMQHLIHVRVRQHHRRYQRRSGFCNSLTGKCACLGMWTGPTFERALGDFSVSAAAGNWYQPSLGTTCERQIDGKRPHDPDVRNAPEGIFLAVDYVILAASQATLVRTNHDP